MFCKVIPLILIMFFDLSASNMIRMGTLNKGLNTQIQKCIFEYLLESGAITDFPVVGNV